MAPLLDLRDITLCAADSANISLTARAIRLSKEQCDFGDAILASHNPVEGPFRWVKIDKFNSSVDYQKFRLKRLPEITDTPFVLSIEWDGYVVAPRVWTSAFREYDYIGAKWPFHSDGMTVGNSGFCLQSRRLLKALGDRRIDHDGRTNVDDLICRIHRPMLEREYGIRFAPESIADLFSYESGAPDNPTFGFHGCGNMWRHVNDAEMIQLVELLDPYVFRTGHFAILVYYYYLQRRFPALDRTYGTMRKHLTRAEVERIFSSVIAPTSHPTEVVAFCERLLSRSSIPAG